MKKILLLFFLSINIAMAVRVPALYQGVLPVASQSADLRNELAPKALAQVLVKVSGSNDILNNPQIKQSLNSASRLMQEFSYAPNTNTQPYLLKLNFDPDGINQLLKDSGAPIWGQNRPLLLVWLDMEAPKKPAEIVAADGNSLSDSVKQNTDRRGLPIIFPAMDVEDMAQVSVNDVVTMNIPKLMNAAKRYASDAILIGRITSDANGYNTQWKLIMGNDQWGWTITGKSLPDIFGAMSDHVADTLAGRFATVITNTVQSNFTMKVTNVSEAEDFVQVMNYIKHLTPVSDAELIQISGSDMILKVSLRGSQESFTKALSVGQKLTPVTSTDPSVLVYQWNH